MSTNSQPGWGLSELSADAPHSKFSMPFSASNFLELDSITKLPPEDVTFLEMKGCLHIPEKSSLDKFVRQYFLHIHPLLPVVNEAEFWAMFNHGFSNGALGTMSLFVFQAMLSASCVVSSPIKPRNYNTGLTASQFISAGDIQRAGFTDYRIARTTFYRRAKASARILLLVEVHLC